MKGNFFRIFVLSMLSVVSSLAMAGGRYANPPVGLVESHQLCSKALDAANAGDTAAALENARQARKVSLASYKELSTMPMEIASSSSKKAINSLEAGNVADAITELQHCKDKLTSEIEYYKSEGKL